VGVHIADVSFFVRAASKLDAYAARRGTTTYLTQYCLPMLPHTLSEELCSLNPKQDRLAFSVLWRFARDCSLIHDPRPSAPEPEAGGAGRSMGWMTGGGACWVGRSVIRSKCRMAYETAQAIIDGKTDATWPHVSAPEAPLSVDEVKEDVKALYSITKLLRARRFQEGSVSINQSKVGFALGADGLPTDIHFHEQREANQLVEELMLLANQTVAAIIAAAYPQQALLRRHPQPLEKSLADLKRVCEATGLALTGTSSVELQRLMERVDASAQNPLLALLLRQQCAKAMQLAQAHAPTFF
jgi:exoribonuclease R